MKIRAANRKPRRHRRKNRAQTPQKNPHIRRPTRVWRAPKVSSKNTTRSRAASIKTTAVEPAFGQFSAPADFGQARFSFPDDLRRAKFARRRVCRIFSPALVSRRGLRKRADDYLFENCGARRAFFKPYFFLSLLLGSRVKNPSFFSAGRSSGCAWISARAMP